MTSEGYAAGGMHGCRPDSGMRPGRTRPTQSACRRRKTTHRNPFTQPLAPHVAYPRPPAELWRRVRQLMAGGGPDGAVRLGLGTALGRAAGLLMKGLEKAERQARALGPAAGGGGAAGDIGKAAGALAVAEALEKARLDLGQVPAGSCLFAV